MLAVFTLAVALSMDATAVAAAKGLAAKHLRLGDALKVALLFGGFQGGMPVIGWAVGERFARFIEAWDHWIAFVLLAGLGGKMIYEAIWKKDDEPGDDAHTFAWKPLLLLSVATSIDALAAGLTLPLLRTPIVVSASVIGVTTAVLSFAGAYAGKTFGDRLGKKLEVFGGVLLVGLGVKIVVEHLGAG